MQKKFRLLEQLISSDTNRIGDFTLHYKVKGFKKHYFWGWRYHEYKCVTYINFYL